MKFLTSICGWFSGSTIGKYLIEGLVLIGAIGGLYAKVRLDGEHAQQGKDAEAVLKDVSKADKVEQAVEKMKPDQVDDELANKWGRP